MGRKDTPIALLASSAQPFCKPLYNTIIDLGYTDVVFCNCEGLLAEEVPWTDKLFVLPLNGLLENCEDFSLLTDKITARPVLGILPSAEQDLSRHLLRYCDEFLCWPCNKKELALRLSRLSNSMQNTPANQHENTMDSDILGLNMVGNSRPFLQVIRQIRKIAGCAAPVLIEGETGTGKELAARAIHYLSDRQDYPFIPVNCGAIPDSLLENELFGHRKGAFTDAKANQRGLIIQAEGGTLFLDEVEAFSQKGQVVLLRFLQDMCYRPLGSDQARRANVRIIAASNTKLKLLVDSGLLRQDFYFRLNIMFIEMPSLRQRLDDIKQLADHFLDQFREEYQQPEKYLAASTLGWMQSYNWPGNIRELENMLHREFLLSEESAIQFGGNGVKLKERRNNTLDRRRNLYLDTSFAEAKTRVISQFEGNYLSWLMHEAEGNVTRAAKIAGKERRALGKLLKKHKIAKDPP